MASKVSVQYIGHHPAVEVDLDGLGEQTLVREQTVEVDYEVAKSLLEQPRNWRVVEKVSAPKSKPEEAK